MSEDLRDLLKGADRPRPPAPDELDRMRARVLDRAMPERGELIIIQPKPDPLPPRRRWLVAAAAGVALLAFAATALQLQRVDQADVAVVPPPAPVCEEVDDVNDALAAWRTIDDWARLASTDPDLAAEVADVLEELSPPQKVSEADVERVLRDLDEASDPGLEGQRTATRTAAVTEAMQLAIDELEGSQAGCDIRVWVAALE